MHAGLRSSSSENKLGETGMLTAMSRCFDRILYPVRLVQLYPWI